MSAMQMIIEIISVVKSESKVTGKKQATVRRHRMTDAP